MPDFCTPEDQFKDYNVNTLNNLLGMVNGKLFCEIGAWTGHSTSLIARRAKENGGMVYVIDTFQGEGGYLPDWIQKTGYNVEKVFLSNMLELGLTEYLHILKGSSDIFHPQINDESLDFLFIDGDHRYNQISKDINNYYPKVKKGGIICGHDCEGPEYNELYINEDWVGDKHHGVCKAVFEKFTPKLERGIWMVIK